MNDTITYFRNKITYQSYSILLNDEQLLSLLTEKFKSGELTKLFVTDPLNIIQAKTKVLKKLPFYKSENDYIDSLMYTYKQDKIFNLDELAIISQKIDRLTIYINDLYEKATDKKNIYQKIEPLILKIEQILDDEMPIYLRNQYEVIRRKLIKANQNKTFKLIEIEKLISETEQILEEYNYEKEIKQKYETQNKYRQKYKVKLTRICAAITIFAFILSSYKISSWVVDNNNIKKEINKIDSVANVIASKTDDEYKDYLFDVNIEELKKINNETIGYIKVKGTNIDYPIVQTKDNSYYLSHSFEKKFNYAGWIFLDFRNDINNLGKNNIIYAHGRLDGTMFGSLRNTLDKDWYENDDNHIITIVDENKTTLWEVFSVYKIKTENYYITTNFNNVEYLEFIKTLKERSIYDFNNELTLNDKILTLSTCYDEIEKAVLHAKLIKEISR